MFALWERIVFLFFIIIIFVNDKVEGNEIYSLTDKTFDEFTSVGDWFLFFYESPCEECEEVEAILEELAELVVDVYFIGTINCDEEEELRSKFISASSTFPVLKFMKDNKMYKYTSRDYSVSDFIQFLTKGYRDNKSLSRAASSKLVSLDSYNFDNTAATNIWFLFFHTSWCGRCQFMMPKLEEAAEFFEENVKFAKIDCLAEPELCSRFDVDIYPTMLYLRKGVVRHYGGEATVADLTEFHEDSWKQLEAFHFPSQSEFSQNLFKTRWEPYMWLGLAYVGIMSVILGIIFLFLRLLSCFSFCRRDSVPNNLLHSKSF